MRDWKVTLLRTSKRLEKVQPGDINAVKSLLKQGTSEMVVLAIGIAEISTLMCGLI
jgi:hypothetical protein